MYRRNIDLRYFVYLLKYLIINECKLKSCLTIEDIALNKIEATQSHNQTGNTQ